MAWPPPTLPTNYANATPQQDQHPGAHNITNAAVNDTVNQLKTVTTFAQDVNAKADVNAAAIGKILRPPALVPIAISAGTATTTESSIATFNVTAAGLYLIGWALAVSTASGYGFVDASLKDQGGTRQLSSLLPFRWYEAPRQAPHGLAITELALGDTVHVRVKTFAASVPIEGGSVAAALLRAT